MGAIEEVDISRAILSAYHEALLERLESDVIIVGAGPSGMMAASDLARRGIRTTILEKRLSPGGGIWGGSIGMSKVAIQAEAFPLLEELGVARDSRPGDLYAVDAIELAAALCLKAMQAGAAIFNLMMVEDLRVQGGRVTGVVANRTMIGDALPVDPITFAAKAVIDATGHEADVVDALRRRGLLAETEAAPVPAEGPMDAAAGEAFVVDHAGEVFPGLWVTGMTVCATFSGPRMGPIFGGMLQSGRRVAELVAAAVAAMS